MIERLYESDDVAVDFLFRSVDEPIYITFSSHHPNHDGVAGLGAWQNQIVREGKNGLFFIAKANHWFNFVDLAKVVELALPVRARFRFAVGIGASMGAHAAIRLSRALSMTSVVAISPQFCVSEQRAPFEPRWRQDVAKIQCWNKPISPDAVIGPVHVIYDGQHKVDARHVNAIEGAVPIHRVELSHSGHSSVGGLGDIGGMNLIFAALDETSGLIAMERIRELYRKNSDRAATIVLNRAKALPELERRRFLEGVANPIGMQRNREKLQQWMAGQLVRASAT